MAISKKQVIPVLHERIIILDKIKKAEKDISEGKIYTTDEAKQQLSKWLQ